MNKQNMAEKECNHKWIIDKRFADGSVIMLFGDIGNVQREMRYICDKCGEIKYK